MSSAPWSADVTVFEVTKRCIVAECAADLSDEDRATFEAGLASHHSSHAIFEWFDTRTVEGSTEKAYHGTEQTVWRHRVGRCGCRPRVNYVKKAQRDAA